MNDPDPPPFGIVDLVDAFTALRHEYRGHVRQTREVGETIQQAVEKFTQVAAETQRSDAPRKASPDHDKLILTMIDLDVQLGRAIEAVTRSDELRRQRDAAAAADFDQAAGALSPIGRYFAAGLIRTHAVTPLIHRPRHPRSPRG